jgi:hypothetical protein
MQEIYQAANPRDCGIYGAPPDFAARFFTGSCGPKLLGWSSQRALRVDLRAGAGHTQNGRDGPSGNSLDFLLPASRCNMLRIAGEWTRTVATQPAQLKLASSGTFQSAGT